MGTGKEFRGTPDTRDPRALDNAGLPSNGALFVFLFLVARLRLPGICFIELVAHRINHWRFWSPGLGAEGGRLRAVAVGLGCDNPVSTHAAAMFFKRLRYPQGKRNSSV